MKKMFSRAASLLVTIYYWTPFLSFIGSGSACGPPTPPHGSVIKHPLNGDKLTHDNGSVVLFVCKQGFYLVGPPIIKCTGSSWTRINFRCLGFCPELRSIPNGRVVHVPTSAAGKTAVEFYCETNYRLIGRPRLECIDGRWNGSLPFCEELKSCKRLDTPANGTKHGASFNHGAQVDFSCLSGFDLFGSRKLTCRNGFWSASVPSCKAYCMEVRDPPNGRKHGIRFGHSQLVSFECNPGYELVGRSTLQCIDGKWNSTVPICKVMLCPDPLISKNAYVAHPVGNNVKYTHGTTIFLACREGHYLVGIPMMVCNTTFWSKMEFRCIASCPTLGSLDNAVITHITLKYGGEVLIKCQTNYTLIGASRIKCIDGKWNASLPSCKAPCSDPGVPYQGDRIVGGIRHDQTVTFTCPRDYVMKGARTITCSSGRWNNGKPSCLAPCGDPGSPKNGWKFGRDYIHEKSVRFGCNRGYQRIGAETITCQDGRWSNKAPGCKGICGKPSTPYNGFLRGNRYLDGDEVTFICKRNYDLFGSSKLRCVGRNWDFRVPECKGRCTFSGSPDNGYYIGNKRNKGDMVRHGETITYDCDVLYTMEGAYQQRCENGRWNNDPPRCKAPCINPGDITHGRKIGNDYRHGKTVAFVCDGKFSLEGNSQIKCDNGNWNSDSPKCKAYGLPLGIENYKVTDYRRRPSLVRLHGPSSWCTSQAGAYLQIDLDKLYKLTAIATQGSQDIDRWVSNYRIKFKAGAYFLTYRESESEKIRS